jgi:DeoR/GlpR family transcriptional regulator of sugar metabolism
MTGEVIAAIAISVLGVFLGLTSIVLHFNRRDSDREASVRAITATINDYTKTAKGILEKAEAQIDTMEKAISTARVLRPDLPALIAAQWEFVNKLSLYRSEKQRIAQEIVDAFVDDHMTIVLDSGSTTDLVTSALATCGKRDIEVHSNNVFAALHLVGARHVRFWLLPGQFSDRYAAVYSGEANQRLETLPARLFVMAASSLSSKHGIMVDPSDERNAVFKRAVLEKFAGRAPDARLVIAVDASKFSPSKSHTRAVVDDTGWEDLLARFCNQITVVTCAPPRTFSQSMIESYEQETEAFRRQGVRVITVSVERSAEHSEPG